MRYFAFIVGCLLAGSAGAQQVPHPAPMSLPATNVALKTLTGAINLRATRLGFATAGDGGQAVYNWSGTNCPNPDDGAQVQPSGTGCWIADFSGLRPTPMIWGAKGDGTTNDTVPVQRAVNALYRQTLYIGPHRYCIGAPGIVIQKPITIQGSTMGNLYQLPVTDQYGFASCALNIEMLKFTGDGTGGDNSASGSVIRDFVIDAGKAGVNTSGAAVVYNPTSDTRMENIRIAKACIGVDVQNAHTLVVDKVSVTSEGAALGTNCGGIRVGHATTLANTVDIRITNTNINTNAGFGILVEDAGGLFIDKVDALANVNGTIIRPALANQQVTWLFANSSALSDSTCSTGLIIDTPGGVAGTRITGLHFNQTWTSTAGNTVASCSGPGVYIGNGGAAAGGVVKGVHFVGHRSYSNGAEGFLILTGVSDVTIDNSEICANGTIKINTPANTYNGVHLSSGASGIAIRNNRIGASCVVAGTFEGLQGTGIFLAGSNSDLTIVGNDLRGNTALGLGGSSLLTGANVIRGNTGDDNSITNVAAAATLALPMGTNMAITGATTTITNITGMWEGRSVNLFFSGAGYTFTAGSGICNAKTVLQFEQVVAYRMPGTTCSYLR
jgi:hypothetical protein